MGQTLLLVAGVMIAAVMLNRLSGKLGIPALLAFIGMGMLLGTDGLFRIPFDNYQVADAICSVALIFIMFYGGFGTNWKEAKPVAWQALILSSLGTVLTALLVGLFVHLALGRSMAEGFLVGSVIASTDAASVFSILRSKRLNLRYRAASLLEVESGSNDPFSYMLTIAALTIMKQGDTGALIPLLLGQLFFGVLLGFLIPWAAIFLMRRMKKFASGFDAIFLVAVALLSYALPTVIGGNGFLSAYICGIVLGNHRLKNKEALVHFFDGMTGMMQMLLFFLLGLLAIPSRLPGVIVPGLLIALFLTFVARPAAVGALLLPFRSPKQMIALVAWAGMRGAASIVFAIMAVLQADHLTGDLFHLVFLIVLFSILVQGSLIPFCAQKLDMTCADDDVMKTFNDYTDALPIQFIQVNIPPRHHWVGKEVRQLHLPPDVLLVLLMRGEEKLTPNGETALAAGDQVIISGPMPPDIQGVHMYEKIIEKGDPELGHTLQEINENSEITGFGGLIILIRRKGAVMIPRGDTVLMEGDLLVINDTGEETAA